jgi:ATP-dependent protease HslVU (ClpYQ) peptidase subunit
LTIICGLATDDGTFIGSDTLLVAGSRSIVGIPKWYCWRGWAIALAGDWRVANILNNNKEELLTKLQNVNDFIDRLYELLDSKGIGTSTHEEYTRNFGQNILLAKKNGPVWDIDCNLSMLEFPHNKLVAKGTGMEYALGAAHVLNGKPETIMRKALETAIEFSIDCGGEVFIKRL